MIIKDDPTGLLLSAGNHVRLYGLLAARARALGFDYCAYFQRSPTPFTNNNVRIYSNYPVAWQDRYKKMNYGGIDPVVRLGLKSALPIIWSDELFAMSKQFWSEAWSFGVHFGWGQSARAVNGAWGMLHVGWSEEPTTTIRLDKVGVELVWLAQMGHFAMSELLMSDLTTACSRLSAREVEVVRWTADGKTSSEVAEIVKISERTVNFHIQNVLQKLGTPNKIAAVARAVTLGIL